MIFLKHCVQIPSWSTELVAKRPYASIEEVLSAAKQQAATWNWDEIKAALDNHPRISEKQAQAQLSQIEKDFSHHEQSSIAADDDTRLALLKGNLAYEKKYGFIFLIKAAGLSSEAVLHALTSRLQNDSEIEKCIVHQQLAEIALSRLPQELHA